MFFGKFFNAAAPTFSVPKMPTHVMMPPGGSIPMGPTMPGPTPMPPAIWHGFPTTMPATNTGVFTNNGGSGPLPYCDQVGCSSSQNLNCYGAGDTGTCGCPQADGSVVACQRRMLPPCSQICANTAFVVCDVSGCRCQASDGSTVMCARSIFGTSTNTNPQAGPENGSTWHDGTTDQNVDASSGAANGGSMTSTSSGSQPVCEDGFSYSPSTNMCEPNPGGPAPQDSDMTTVTTTTTDPTTGQVSTTQVVTPVPILPTTVPLPGIPDAPLFYQTPAFKVGMIALGVSVLGVAAILVHRSRSA